MFRHFLTSDISKYSFIHRREEQIKLVFHEKYLRNFVYYITNFILETKTQKHVVPDYWIIQLCVYCHWWLFNAHLMNCQTSWGLKNAFLVWWIILSGGWGFDHQHCKLYFTGAQAVSSYANCHLWCYWTESVINGHHQSMDWNFIIILFLQNTDVRGHIRLPAAHDWLKVGLNDLLLSDLGTTFSVKMLRECPKVRPGSPLIFRRFS